VAKPTSKVMVILAVLANEGREGRGIRIKPTGHEHDFLSILILRHVPCSCATVPLLFGKYLYILLVVVKAVSLLLKAKDLDLENE
jgi:hypothetical protein